jgi:orotate phosphoribosyltransferase
MVEDIVTSGGALIDSVEAVREAGLIVNTAVCVVDREEGGREALAAHGIELHPIFRAADIVLKPKTPAKPHG